MKGKGVLWNPPIFATCKFLNEFDQENKKLGAMAF